MPKLLNFLWLFFLLNISLLAETVSTFYGPLEVEEPVLLELMHSPAMQRLKHIHQYGIGYYTTHREEYNRYDHSIGVFALLKKNGASLEEQISGLIHDVSHTVFSHVGDWIFGKEHQENDYQNIIFKLYLSHSGIEDILLKYGYTIDKVFPKNAEFLMLEQPLPNLCADRLDYNIQGAYFQGFLTKEEAVKLYEDFYFFNGCWFTTHTDLLKKLARFSIFMTQNCWGSAVNYLTSRWLADAMLRGLQIGLLSWKEIHFGIDEEIWNKLQKTKDECIKKKMEMIAHPYEHFKLVGTQQEANLEIKFRCRAIDPWVMHKQEKIKLTEIDKEFAHEFKTLQEKATLGWAVQILRELL